MPHALVIVELKQTCKAAPSQWEGRLADDRPLYIRYRWGELTVSVGPPGSALDAAVGGDRLFEGDVGEKLGSQLDIEDVCAHAGLVLAAGLR